jgi:hypothetical protein
MKTNPEEFLTKDGTVPYDGEMFGGKWSDLLDYAWRIANNDEREMITKARDEFYRDDFNERVFKRLAGEEKQGEKEETRKIRLGARYSTGWTDPKGVYGVGSGGTVNATTQMMGSQTIEEYEHSAIQKKMAKQQEDAMRQSKTPFGGLGAGNGGLLGWW